MERENHTAGILIAIFAIILLEIFMFMISPPAAILWGALGLIFGLVCLQMAQTRDRSPGAALMGGYLFGIFSVLYYLAKGDSTELRVYKEEEARRKYRQHHTDKKPSDSGPTYHAVKHKTGHITQTKSKTDQVAKVILLIILVLAVLFCIIAAIGSALGSSSQSSVNGTTNQITQEVQQEDQRAAMIKKYAPEYCKKRKSLKLTGMPDGYPINDGRGWTKKECETIIGKVHDATHYEDADLKEEEIKRVADGNYWIGMSEVALLYSLGNPNDINTTRLENYKSSQYVYGDPIYDATYIYVDNGKVTSVQN